MSSGDMMTDENKHRREALLALAVAYQHYLLWQNSADADPSTFVDWVADELREPETQSLPVESAKP